jgi:hypothetical protein
MGWDAAVAPIGLLSSVAATFVSRGSRCIWRPRVSRDGLQWLARLDAEGRFWFPLSTGAMARLLSNS